MIRFIHLADVHLGAVPDRGCLWSHEREEEIWETFRRVIAAIRKNPVDLLFIAGDLFHHQPLMSQLEEINELLGSIPDTRIFLMAGDQDYVREGSFYRQIQWKPNVFFFDKEARSCMEFSEEQVYVYGLSYEHPEIREPLYDDWKPQEKPGFHVLMAHGGDMGHIPVDYQKLTGAGFDYIAMGHLHNYQVILRDAALYAGAPEPLDWRDTGEHGYIEGEYEDGAVRTRFVPFSARICQNLILTIDENTRQYDLEEMLRNEIMKRGGRNIYRVIIQGKKDPSSLFLPERLKHMGNITEVLDDSVPCYDLDGLLQKYRGTLIGDYIEFFQKDGRTAKEGKALYHGLQALLGITVLTGERKNYDH